VPFHAIRLVQGDSDRLVAGGGTGGSKSLMASGSAIVEAADLVIEKGRNAAAHMLEASPGDIEFERDAEGHGRSSSPARTAPSASWNWPSASAPPTTRRRTCPRAST
jgi:CO/xanthine dehydrogenase Mo-binding subunit